MKSVGLLTTRKQRWYEMAETVTSVDPKSSGPVRDSIIEWGRNQRDPTKKDPRQRSPGTLYKAGKN